MLSIIFPQILNEKIYEKENYEGIITYLEPASSFSLYFILNTTEKIKEEYGEYFIFNMERLFK
ncbi:MAG: hypothetical protein ABGW69_04005 [Nanoarchaeota archaeon]